MKLGSHIKKVFIFDTNAYRVMTFGLGLEEVRTKTRLLCHTEDKIGCCALAHPIVVWELFAHLVDVADPAYKHCLNALVALGVHTASRDQPSGGICLIGDAHSTVCQQLFGISPPGYLQGLQNLGSHVSHIVNHAPDISDPKVQDNIQNLARGMAAKEKEWLKGMEDVLDRFSPGIAKKVFGGSNDSEALKRVRTHFASSAFFDAWANYIVISNAAEVGITNLTIEQVKAKVDLVRKLFPVPFRLMCAMLEKLATPRPANLANPKHKRWNFVWDSMISFSIGNGTIEGVPVYMVTDDGEIVEAAKAAGFDDQVLSLDSYLKQVDMK